MDVVQTRVDVVARCARFTIVGDLEGWSFGETGGPLVLLQHGLGSRKERMLELGLRCAQAGFHAVALDAPAHGDRRADPRARRLDDRDHPEFIPLIASLVAEGAAELARVARTFGAERWSVVGHSLGGRIALEALRVHPEIAAVAVVGAPLGEALIPPDLPEPWRARMLETAPERQGTAFAARPLLVCHGTDDPVTDAAGSIGLHRALSPHYRGAEQRLQLRLGEGVGHDLAPEFQEHIVNFLREHAAA